MYAYKDDLIFIVFAFYTVFSLEDLHLLLSIMFLIFTCVVVTTGHSRSLLYNISHYMNILQCMYLFLFVDVSVVFSFLLPHTVLSV